MKLSLVVPCYNEAESVKLFLDAVLADFDGCGYDYEVIFVNDGSRDNTLFQLKKLYAANKCPTKVLSFSRNFGKEAAIYAGMREAVGEYVSLIDADLQQRPKIVRDMVEILEENQIPWGHVYGNHDAEGNNVKKDRPNTVIPGVKCPISNSATGTFACMALRSSSKTSGNPSPKPRLIGSRRISFAHRFANVSIFIIGPPLRWRQRQIQNPRNPPVPSVPQQFPPPATDRFS